MIDDDELKANIVNTKPYKQWIENLRIKLDNIGAGHSGARTPGHGLLLLDRQQAFGYTQEDIKFPDGPDGPQRRRRHRLHGQRQPAGRALAATSRCTTTSSSCSPR